MSERLSVNAFAKLAGCNEKQVRRAVIDGLLVKGADGKLGPDQIDSGWRKPNRRTTMRGSDKSRTSQDVRALSDNGAVIAVQAGETPAQAAERIIATNSLLTTIDALNLKENYLGRRQQLEYDIRAGTVVLASEVVAAVGEEYAKVRTRLLAMPSKHAPALYRVKTVVEVEDILRGAIVEALEELTRDREPAPAG